jgi:chromosome segregation protein
VKLTRLRLSGFKSFVDPTELPIEPGLTGVVGPNGCGKSNLLEALRWVMGENSAKSMRGEAMDDVIFAGAGARPMRNMAEVALSIDNAERDAPAAHNDQDSFEIVRRIERDMGSHYRINGREVRAKDVQLLFADMASGAHSTSMVRQGQIGQLINAKPTARRAILEEAAGISGLNARRHEAELKLNAAETNLARLADVVQEIEAQLQGLKRQSRQASRYRNISGQIRETEALALHLRWALAREGAAQADAALALAQTQAQELTQSAAAAATQSLEAGEALAPLRQEEAEKAAALQRLTAERLALETEERRALELAAGLAHRLEQIARDLAREDAQARDAREQFDRLAAERASLAQAAGSEAAHKDGLRAAVEDAEALVKTAESAADRMTAELADLRARLAAAQRAAQEAQGRLERVARDQDAAAADLARVDAELARLPDADGAALAVQGAEAEAQASQANLAGAEAALSAARSAEQDRRPSLDAAERDLQRLKAEVKALGALLNVNAAGLWPPVLDLIQVTPGYEAALAAAFGDDLDVSADAGAPVHWLELAALSDPPPLPPGARPLSAVVAAPPALARSLALAGLVDEDQGAVLQASLLPGQRLVSRGGGLWRWDGYVAAAGAPTPAALRLQQRNRLTELDAQTAEAETRAQALREAWHAARQASEAAQAAETAARQANRQAEATLAHARQALSAAERARAQSDLRRQSAADRLQSLTQQKDEAGAQVAAAAANRAALPDLQPAEHALAAQRSETALARARLAEARGKAEAHQREADARTRRLTAIAQETDGWTSRRTNAEAHIATLTQRRGETQTERAQALEIPRLVQERRVSLLDLIRAAEAARTDAADALAAAESRAKSLASSSRALDAALAQAREDRARADVLRETAREKLADITATAREVLDCEPEALLAKAEVRDPDNLPPLAQVETKVERLKKERESLGGVNLRAEEEAAECEARLTQMLGERADLEAAIARLRAAIGTLNREGRERLVAAFDTVNANFQKLFTSLFQGGEARLTLTESDDPLAAGLDILARPPGKKLQVMSLLSGGEQALTAMALIFAVFLVNPAPICVLDEVDAPLDDANVERFCNLLQEMTRTTATRFLVITHHALTMSRMDRLVGVTMQERGVSQLVSVDLSAYAQQAAE